MRLPPGPRATGLTGPDTLDVRQPGLLPSPFSASAADPGASHAADARASEQPQRPAPQHSTACSAHLGSKAECSLLPSRSAGGAAESEMPRSGGGCQGQGQGQGASGMLASVHPGREPDAWPRVPACVGSGGALPHAAATKPNSDPDTRPGALGPGTPAGGDGGSGSLRDGHAADNPGPDPEPWPKAPESVASVGGAGGLVEVVGACFPVVVALYCSGVYFVLAFPFFTYVPTSGAMGARMLPKARLGSDCCIGCTA